jgi:type IV pilus assembly protein PilX
MNTRPSLPTHSPFPRHRQTGATLIVGLVLLLVLTVVGVSGMNTATMEITMAANTQFQQDAFQLAEEGIDIAIATKRYSTDNADPRTTVDWLGTPDFDRRAVTIYLEDRNTPAPGSSVGEIDAFHFDIVSVGRGPRNAASTHNQSFYVVGRAQ